MLCLSGMDSQRIANTAALQMVHVGIWYVLRPQKGFPDKRFRAKVYCTATWTLWVPKEGEGGATTGVLGLVTGLF